MKTLDLSQIGAIYIACGYTDMRRGINGLAAQVQQQFRLDPRQQAVFLFCGKRSDRFKACSETGTDLCCCTNVWRTDAINGRVPERKYSSSPSSNIAGSWKV
jgi:transposase